MSLTLFPITAILLLLSGMGAPARATGYGDTLAGLRRQFFGDIDVLTPRRVSSAVRTQRAIGRPYARARRSEESVEGELSAIAPTAGGARRLQRKQYRTRFGFAEGAYLAVGPPVAHRLAELA